MHREELLLHNNGGVNTSFNRLLREKHTVEDSSDQQLVGRTVRNAGEESFAVYVIQQQRRLVGHLHNMFVDDDVRFTFYEQLSATQNHQENKSVTVVSTL